MTRMPPAVVPATMPRCPWCGRTQDVEWLEHPGPGWRRYRFRRCCWWFTAGEAERAHHRLRRAAARIRRAS
jgi:hypothetical protein